MASQHLKVLHRLLEGLPDSLPLRQSQALTNMLADLSDQEAERISAQLQHDLPLIGEAVLSYNSLNLSRPFLPQDWLLGWGSSPSVDQGGLVLVGIYLLRWRGQVFWERILDAQFGGFLLYVHERAELEWFLVNHAETQLNALLELDQGMGYEASHPIAILLEHLYAQLRAQEDSKVLTLRELIEADPQSNDGVADWLHVAEHLATYDLHLDPAERGLDRLDEAKQWYHARGVQPLQLPPRSGAPTRGRVNKHGL